MIEGVGVQVPGGLWRDGERHAVVTMRSLTGADEEFLVHNQGLPQGTRVTAVLARCILEIGSVSPVDAGTVDLLSIGDREALLLHLRRLTLGERLDLVLDCVNPACGERLGIELAVGDLLLPPYEDWRHSYELELREDEELWALRFRPPNGADQRAAASLANTDPTAAAGCFIERCVEVEEGPAAAASRLPERLVERVAAEMAERDPQADIELHMTCPGCEREFDVPFDAAEFFFLELAQRAGRLFHEVHTLAFHYHWGEGEIMRMTALKRRRYLGLLADELSAAAR